MERLKEYCDYIDNLFKIHASIIVLRLDVFYNKEHAHSTDIHQAQKDLDHLLNNRRSNKIFAYMLGYIAKIEYGIEKGIHIHLIYFFNGSKRDKDSHSYLAGQIGEYWVSTVTNGRGAYWNVHNQQQLNVYAENGLLGIGSIHHSDEVTRKNLSSIIEYFCKIDQFIRPRFGEKVRLYCRGKLKKIPPNKLGRPRKA